MKRFAGQALLLIVELEPAKGIQSRLFYKQWSWNRTNASSLFKLGKTIN
jgi:hypothetical protein